MPNRSSKAGHMPIRTCVVCRKKDEKSKMIRFVIAENEIVIDWGKRNLMRGYYTCNDNECLVLLEKWLKKRLRKRTVVLTKQV